MVMARRRIARLGRNSLCVSVATAGLILLVLRGNYAGAVSGVEAIISPSPSPSPPYVVPTTTTRSSSSSSSSGSAGGNGDRESSDSRLNVLMISVDDLRTELSVYPEGAHMHTPNVARLASRGVVFERAYVAVALCMPSRTALLTSRRPDTSRSWTIEADQYFRVSGGRNFTTLPQLFKEKGYLTVGMGKVVSILYRAFCVLQQQV